MHNDPQPSRQQRPAWLIWTIVGGAAALVAIAGVAVIIAVAKHGGSDEQTGGQGGGGSAAAVDQLRAHLPANLKSARECVESTALPYANATIACTWASSHVPRAATYSLFDDGAAMTKSALTLVRESGYGPSCRSASDFSSDGGEMPWQRDNRQRGTVWCYLNDNDEPVITWTDTAPKILASAVASAPDDAGQLLNWFLTTGQASLEAQPGAPPAPTTQGPPETSGPRRTSGSLAPVTTTPDTPPETTPNNPVTPNPGPT